MFNFICEIGISHMKDILSLHSHMIPYMKFSTFDIFSILHIFFMYDFSHVKLFHIYEIVTLHMKFLISYTVVISHVKFYVKIS